MQFALPHSFGFSLFRLKVLLFSIFIGVSLSAQEICDNGFDDDGDGLIDCYDPDCCNSGPCINNSFDCLPTVTENCAIIYPVTVKNLWKNSVDIDTRRTPVAGDIDGDSIVEVVVAGSGNQGIVIANGQTGATEQILSFKGHAYFDAPAIGDINHDGISEIFAVDNNSTLIRWEYSGGQFVESVTLTGSWAANPTIGYGAGTAYNWSPALADFNHDGVVEVYFGNQIWNAETGELIASSPNGVSDPFGRSSDGANVNGSEAYTSAADVLPDNFCTNCDGLELVAGPVVYSIDWATKTLNIEVDARGPNNVIDGTTSIADWNGDGLLDVAVNSADCYLYVYDPRTGALFNTPYKIPGAIFNSHPAIGDVDYDGEIELVAPGKNVVVALDNDFTVLWQKSSNDGSSKTTASLYDLNGDYIFELIYLDEDGLHIWDAATGNVVEFIPCASGTRTNYPIIADVNSDGEANIVCTCRDQSPFPGSKGATGKLQAFKSKENPWLPSRRVMNQHSYYITNINDDLTVPQYQQNNALHPKLNMYLSQGTFYGGRIGSPVADATIDTVLVTYSCKDNKTLASLNIILCNTDGEAPIDSGFPVALYNDDPALQQWIKNIYTSKEVPPGACDTLKSSLLFDDAFHLFLKANDTADAPDQYIDQFILECDTTNNVFDIELEDVEPSIVLENDSVSCNGLADGKAYLESYQLLTAPLNYLWNGANSNDTLLIGVGQHYLQVTDAQNCTVIDSVEIFEPLPLAIDVSKQDAGCDDIPTGSIDIQVTGGVPQYVFSIDSGATFQNTGQFQNISSGTYNVVVKDANNCEVYQSIILNYLGDTPTITANNVVDVCLFHGDTVLSVSPSNGSASGVGIVQSSPPIFNSEDAGVGQHQITYTTTGVCPASKNFVVAVVNQEVPVITGPKDVCIEDDFVNYSVNSTSGQWQGAYINNQGVFDVQAAGNGDHVIHYNIQGTCPADTHFTIKVSDKISAAIIPPQSICVTSSPIILQSVNPGGVWSGSGITNTTTGEFTPDTSLLGTQIISYEIIGICGDSQSVAIQVLDTNYAKIIAPDSLCAKADTVLLTATPSQGLWQSNFVDSGGKFKALPGIHTIIYENNSACGINDTVRITVLDSVSIIQDTLQVSCFGDSIPYYRMRTMGGVQPFQYTWDTPINTTHQDSAFAIYKGTYQMEILDAKNCLAQGILEVEEPTQIKVIDTLIQHLSCTSGASCDGEVTFNISGGTTSNGIYQISSDNTFLQSPGKNKITQLCQGTHQITIEDDNQCEIKLNVVLTKPSQFALSIDTVGNEHCNQQDGLIKLNPIQGGASPFSFQWNSGQTTQDISNLSANYYQVTVVDSNNCQSTIDTTIINEPAPDFYFQATPISCYGGNDGTLTVIAHQPSEVSSIQWTNGTTGNLAQQLSAGSHEVTVEDVYGCQTTKDTILSDGPEVLIASVSPIELCFGEQKRVGVQVTAGNGGPYQYVSNGIHLSADSVLVEGNSTYWVYGIDQKGCMSDSIEIGTNELPLLDMNPLTDTTVCKGQVVYQSAQAFSGKPPYTYHWSNGSQDTFFTQQINDAKSVYVDVEDECNHMVTDTFNISVFAKDTLTYIVTPKNGCAPLNIEFTLNESEGATGYFQLDSNQYPLIENTSHSVILDRAGTYLLEAEYVDPHQCTYRDVVDTISVYPIPNAAIVASPYELNFLQLETRLSLKNMAHVNTTEWFIYKGADTVGYSQSYPFWQEFPEEEGKYQITTNLLSVHGCENTIYSTIKVKSFSTIYVPSGFTPDGDGINDGFGIGYFNILKDHFKVNIFNRWGELVFEHTSPDFIWDGTYLGEVVKEDVYVVKIEYRDVTGKDETVFGKVTLLR